MPKSLSQLTDAELLDVGTQTEAAMTADPPTYGTTSLQLTPLTTKLSAFDDGLNGQTSAEAAKVAATAVKDDARVELIAELQLRRDTAKVHGTSEADMLATGLPSGGSSDGSIATVPVVIIDTSRRLHHSLSWGDAGTPTSRKRPSNAASVEIWRKIDGPPPVDISECRFVAIDTATPYVTEYTGADGGKIAHYMLRWHLRDGSTTAFGETASATITG